MKKTTVYMARPASNNYEFLGDQEIERIQTSIRNMDVVFRGATSNIDSDAYDIYVNTLKQARINWSRKSNLTALKKIIQYLPAGYRTNFPLKGWTLGSLCASLCNNDLSKRDSILKGLYFTGVVTTFTVESENVRSIPEGRYGEGFFTPAHIRGGYVFNYSSQKQSVIDIPMWNILWPQEMRSGGPATWVNASFETYIQKCIQSEGGSDVSIMMASDGCYILRRYSYIPIPFSTANSVIRTGALSQIVTKDYNISITCLNESNRSFVVNVCIPSGKLNCIFSCIIEGLKQYYVTSASQLGLSKDEALETGEKFANNTISAYTEYYIAEIFRKRKVPLSNDSYLFRKAKRSLKKELSIGFSNNAFFKLYDFYLRSFKIVLNMIYVGFSRNGIGKKMTVRGARREDLIEIQDNFIQISFCQCDANGMVYSSCENQSLKESDEKVSGSLHAVQLFPFFKRNDIIRCNDEVGLNIIQNIELVTTRCFKEIQLAVQPVIFSNETYFQYEEIERLVSYQNNRYKSGEAKETLIFLKDGEEITYKDRRPQIPNSKRIMYEKSTAPLIFAYDIETVRNCGSAQKIVDDRFRKAEPDLLIEEDLLLTIVESDIPLPQKVSQLYTPCETQIPFTCQWVTVNLSDSGRHYEKKKYFHLEPVTYNSLLSEEELRNEPSIPSFPEDEKLSDYILSPPVTNYGDKKLGACVDEMLTQMAMLCRDQNTNSAYAYAHNGCGFDAYIVLQYTSFHFLKVLKTDRGLLSVTILIPLDGDGDRPPVRITLRDTKVHVPGSLAGLCKGFSVPSSWRKTEFPIYLVNHRNCYDDQFEKIMREYGENDVLCLAYIIRKINDSLCDSNWEPGSITSKKPPIAQLLTCMSMVKKATFNHFTKTLSKRFYDLPKAVDVTLLRNTLKKALIGGRVNPFAKSYCSPYFKHVVDSLRNNESEILTEDLISQRKMIHSMAVKDKQYMKCLDVTSLYPEVMAHCPLPTGNQMIALTSYECYEHIESVGCDECDRMYTFCLTHLKLIRPFSIIIINNLRFPMVNLSEKKDFFAFQNLQARKDKHGSLIYSLQEQIEGESNVQAYSNVDLYWMKRQGFTFNILCGFGWETSYDYRSFIEPAFQERIAAKKAGNKIVSNLKKLGYNGSYGVTTQSDITDNWFIITLPAYLTLEEGLDPEDPRLLRFILHETDAKVMGPDDQITEVINLRNGQSLIKIKKKVETAESFSDLSPMQIGVAVLSWARHKMNLMMANISPSDYTYTDTDSVTLGGNLISKLETYHSYLFNETDEAPLGSYKNDHLENNGTNPIILFSMIGAKKVKMHITLNELGEVKIFNTYKGLNPVSQPTIDSFKYHSDYVQRQISLALFQICCFGSPNAVTVARWKRKLDTGVEIGTSEQNADHNTYLGFARGTLTTRTDYGTIEMFVPQGFWREHKKILDLTKPGTGNIFNLFYYDACRDLWTLPTFRNLSYKEGEDYFIKAWGFNPNDLGDKINKSPDLYPNADKTEMEDMPEEIKQIHYALQRTAFQQQ